jgi:hypothetical protein
MQNRVVAVVVFLFVAGWLAVVAGPPWVGDPFSVEHLAWLAARWPGSVVDRVPVEVMGLLSGLLGAFLLVIDPATNVQWRAGIYRLMARTGSAVLALGSLQVLTGARGIFWRAEAMPVGSAFFATFFEEEIGVAFATFVWPLAAGGLIGRLGVAGTLTRREWAASSIWGVMVIVGWLAVAVTGSLRGLAISGVLLSMFVAWVLWRVPSMSLRIYGKRGGAVAGLAGMVAVAGALAVGKSPAFHSQWTRLQAILAAESAAVQGEAVHRFGVRPDGLILSDEKPTESDFASRQRQKLREVPVRMLSQSGLLGFGPGSWVLAFPHFTDDALLRSHYLSMQFAQNDYLQSLVEWGVLGTAAWAILILGGISAGLYRLRRYRSKGGRIGEKEGMVAGSMVGLCGVLGWAWWSFPLQVPAIQLYAALVLGLLWAAGERQGWSGGERPQDVISKSVAA